MEKQKVEQEMEKCGLIFAQHMEAEKLKLVGKLNKQAKET